MAVPIRVYVVDDHEAVRVALVRQLHAAPGLRVVGESGAVESARADIVAQRPDVILLETKRADGRGLELLGWVIKHSGDARIVVLTSYPSEWERWAVTRAGAAGYLLKDIGTTQLVEQLRSISAPPAAAAPPAP